MGCDIHAHIEVKMNDEWVHYSALTCLDRDYMFFGIIAGVRCYEEQKFEVRGFPEDATKITKMDYDLWGEDAHTHSWLKGDEVVEAIKLLGDKRRLEDLDRHQYADFLLNYEIRMNSVFGYNLNDFEYLNSKFGITDTRLVFWFDS